MSTIAMQVIPRGMPKKLADQGWELLESDTPPRKYRAFNEQLDANIGPYPDMEEAQKAAWDFKTGEEAGAAEADRLIDEAKQSPAAARTEIVARESRPPSASILALSDISTDGGTQPREALDMLVVVDYREAMLAGAEFPPVDVFLDLKANKHWLADGFHRVRAAQDGGFTRILANVHMGSQRDALLFSFGANETHGLRRSNADKRRAVLTMLHDDEWRELSDTVIASTAKVSQPFVSKIRRELSQNVLSEGEAEQPARRKGADGVVRDTTNIGGHAEAESDEVDERQTTLADVGVALPEKQSEPPETVGTKADAQVETATAKAAPGIEGLSLDVPVIINLAIKAGKNPKRGLTISGRAGDGKPIFLGDFTAADLEPMPRAMREILGALVKSHARCTHGVKPKIAGQSKKKTTKKARKN